MAVNRMPGALMPTTSAGMLTCAARQGGAGVGGGGVLVGALGRPGGGGVLQGRVQGYAEPHGISGRAELVRART